MRISDWSSDVCSSDLASLGGEWQAVQILRAGGERAADIRPLVRLNVSVVVGEGERMEAGSHGGGGRIAYETLLDPAHWQAGVDEALRQALVNLAAVDTPAGEMPEIGRASCRERVCQYG